MKSTVGEKRGSRRSRLKYARAHPTRRLKIILAILLTGSALLAVVVRAYNREAPKPLIPVALHAEAGKPGQDLHGRLSFQPEADRLRARLGQRFLAAGRERAIVGGRLSIGTDQHQVRIVRSENEGGEQLEISLENGSASLTWNGIDGAKSAGREATGIERTLIERLALDSPEQFVLAQVRGASYYTVAHNVRPAEAGDSESYAGPVWDIVRINEPENASENKPQSRWRLYYINSKTKLIDKVLSQEQGDTIIAEFSGWTNQGGEMVPTAIKWNRKGQVVMELALNYFALAPSQ